MKLKIFIILTVLILVPVLITLGQPPPPDPQDIPIDGGLSFLLAAGGIYALKKIFFDEEDEKNN